MVLTLLLLPSAAYASKPVHVPDWVRQAAAIHTPAHLRSRDSALVLLDQTDITVDPQGRATVHHREVIRLLTVSGRSYAEHSVFYEPGGKFHYLHSWTFGADEHEYQLDDKNIPDLPAVPEFAIFDSTRVRLARALAAEPGAVVAFESEVVEPPYTSSWEFEVDRPIPTLAQTITLTLPPGMNHSEGWAHMDPLKPEQLGPSEWRWQLPARESLDDEPSAPELGEVAARMLLAYAGGPVQPSDGSWSTVGTWYSNLNRDRSASSPEIAAKVADLTAGKSAFSDKLLSITGFMQDQIRYVAVEMGIGGWQPHPAPAVFHNRFGDCKDKATLLITMLADAGITAYPLVVDFDHRVDPGMPTHYANHMITAIELPPGIGIPAQQTSVSPAPAYQAVVTSGSKRLLIFDPTNSVSPPGSLESELQGSYGLLLEGPASTLIQLPVLPPEANHLQRTGEFTLAADGSVSGSVSEQLEGNTADVLRHLYLQGDTRKVEEHEARRLHRTLPGVILSDLQAEHAADRALPLILRYRVSAGGYSKHAGPLLLVRPSILSAWEPATGDTVNPRQYPIALGREEALSESYTIHLPAAYAVDDLPEPLDLDTPFAAFHSTVGLDGTTLHYTSKLEIRRLQIPPADAGDYRDFIARVSNAERAQAILKPVP